MSYLGPSLRRSVRRTRRPWRRVVVALAISLLVNGLVLKELDVGWMAKPAAPAPRRDVTLAPLSASQWAANRAIRSDSSRSAPLAPALPAKPVPAPPPPPPPRNMPGQVVDVAPSSDSTPPKDSRFVSDRNNTVAKETRSRHAKAGYEHTLPTPSSPKNPSKSPTPPQPPSPPAVARQERQERPPGKPGAPGPPDKTLPSDAPRKRLALIPGGELRNPLSSPPSVPRRGGEGGQGGAGGDQNASRTGPLARLDLRPGAAAFDRFAGGPAPDYLEGVEEGDGTYLNTREWKYAGYFNRIKAAVASMWDPSTSLAARDPNGSRFGDKDWQTLLSIKLDANGTLKNVSVARSSGLEFLDRTAVDAFQKAQPFANPPAGLADDHGEIAFTFGFYVQTGGAGMRLFRGMH